MSVPSSRSSVVASFVLLACLAVPSLARAQDPSSKAQPPAASPAPLPPPKSAEPVVVQPAPGQAAASAPAPDATPITATCMLGDHPGVVEAEARTAADVICHELARQGATNTQHEVRFGTLGGKTLVTVASRNGNAYDERRTFVSNMDEINVAAPRLVTSLVDGKPLEDTRNVDNVLSSETRQSKVRNGAMAFDGGLFGTTALNTNAGASAGVALGLLYRAGNFGVGSQGRAGGIGSGDKKIGLATLDIGGRYYLSSSEIAPFIGAGLGLSYHKLNREREGDLSGSGFGAYLQAGAEMLRTHHASLSFSVRLDAPFYSLTGTQYALQDTSSYGVRTTDASQYVMPLSFNVGLLFH